MSHQHVERTVATRLMRTRPLFALLVALALLFQTTLAERHFEPLLLGTQGHGPTQLSSVDGVTPIAPLAGALDEDCALCQFLALGIATDIPRDFADWLRPALDTTPLVAPESTKPREQSRGAHQARAPPSPSIA